MKALGAGIVTLSALALVACGASSNTAPVVYGTPPSSTGRIYNAPADLYRNQSVPVQQAATAPVYQEPLPGLAETQPVYVAQARGAANYVQVQPGDTVYAIARRFGVSPQAIIAENRLGPPFALAIGQTLRLPDAAPVQQAAPTRRIVARDALYTVQAGDTLFSIARANGVTVQAVAQANRLYPPYDLQIGRQLLIPGARTAAAPKRTANAPSSVEDIARSASYTSPTPEPSSLFDWPVKGAIIAGFGSGGPGRRNDGVNIAAPSGAPVRAAAAGEVVYRGSEIDGYGNLLLIKHDGGYVTAYAHNDAMLVRKGQRVRRGQMIAKVGKSGAVSEPQLHFEIRRNLKAVDPLGYLGSQ
ncbi:MAG: peptidoglycan DD-metalloendopeptidase family protein [Parvularculaceae bacterium]